MAGKATSGLLVYRCPDCRAGFAILSLPKGTSTKKGVRCPLGCKGLCIELDPIEAVGSTIVRHAVKFWKSLPSGDDDD